MESLSFRQLNSEPQQFFDMLPSEWQKEIAPFWKDYESVAKIYVIEEDDVIIGGGIMFSACPPNFTYFEDEANYWFSKDYLYLGFIWIAKHKRSNNLGSYWLSQLKKAESHEKYFLLTEENRLHQFYIKNGFTRIKSLKNEDHFEWLYLSENQS
ncbi:GNAT family N-acetyltransferase [Gelidibacter salicanalis]|uniref:GNAT family N-acetyltransferase n=1 Tax=Gelidibacter salicanalis TaxID=291193 RepID=A0A5C7AAS5_9FLAO|nr:GNAT family N-acetyltransferase [Gelidibacter salicanalis]TXE05648.1 GNAT family N-acetyltransferase [Gelidibacter salicanalis]